MKFSGKYWIIKWKDGAHANTMAETKEEAIARAPKYHKGEIESVEPLYQKKVKVNEDYDY